MVYHDDPAIPGDQGRPRAEPSPADLGLDKVDDATDGLDDEAGDEDDQDDL